MRWSDIRRSYPDRWLIVEALEAYTTADKRRHLEALAVIEGCPDGGTALQRYRQLHQRYPEREFYFVHTSRQELEIQERDWLGIRTGHAANPEV